MTRMPVSETSAMAPRKSIDDRRSSTTTSMYFLRRTPKTRFSPPSGALRFGSNIANPGTRIIEVQNRAGVGARECHAACTPLTKSDAVSQARTFDDERALRLRLLG